MLLRRLDRIYQIAISYLTLSYFKSLLCGVVSLPGNQDLNFRIIDSAHLILRFSFLEVGLDQQRNVIVTMRYVDLVQAVMCFR